MLFEMLCGRPTFVPGEGSELSIRVAQVETTPPFVSQLLPGAPAALDAFFARALAKSPDARFQNEGDLVEAAARAMGFAPSPSWRRQAEFAHAAKGATRSDESQLRELRGQVENGYKTQAIGAFR